MQRLLAVHRRCGTPVAVSLHQNRNRDTGSAAHHFMLRCARYTHGVWMLTRTEFEAACKIVHAAMPPTPQFAWPLLKQRTGVDVVIKHENHTPTGAFKVRGGILYANRLKRERPHVKGVITATRGNHGQSLAFACARAGVACTVVVPFGNST